MALEILVHWALELGGSGAWACVRGRCSHRSHRIALDAMATLVLAATTVRLMG